MEGPSGIDAGCRHARGGRVQVAGGAPMPQAVAHGRVAPPRHPPPARGRPDARCRRAVRGDGLLAEAAVRALPRLPGGDVARCVVVAAGAGVGGGHHGPAPVVQGALVVAPAARRARHRDDGELRLRAALAAAVDGVFDLLRRPVADHRVVGAVPRRTRRAAALDRDRHRPGRRAGGVAADGRGRAEHRGRGGVVRRAGLRGVRDHRAPAGEDRQHPGHDGLAARVDGAGRRRCWRFPTGNRCSACIGR